MIEQVFTPGWGSEFPITNATSASAAFVLPESCREVALTNTSTTATAWVFVTRYDTSTPPAGTAPVVGSTGLPILPGQQIRIGVGVRGKVIRAIASAADGLLMVNPGNGG